MKSESRKHRASAWLLICHCVLLAIFSLLAFTPRDASAKPLINIIQKPTTASKAIVFLSDSPTFEIFTPGYCLLEVALQDRDGIRHNIKFRNDAGNDCMKNGPYSINVAELIPGIYDLLVKVRLTTECEEEDFNDSQPRSVLILDRPPETIKFAWISDSHTGDPRSSMMSSPLTPKQRREKVFTEASKSGAMFVLITGDIVSVPGNYQKEYPEAYAEIAEWITIPVFAAPGNHDLYTSHATLEKPDGATYWQKYFGALNYDFNIGPFAFVALDTYDWPRKYRNFMDQTTMNKYGSYQEGAVSKEQFSWLEKVLEKHRAAGQTIIAFGHHAPNVHLAPVPGELAAQLAQPGDVVKLLTDSGVKAFLAGHVHVNCDTVNEGLRVVTVASASAQIQPDEAWGYMLCTISAAAPLKCEFVRVVEQ